jgi:LysM repeat protein
VNNVQSVPAQTPGSSTDGGTAAQPDDGTGAAGAALPTAVTLPTAAPSPEPTVDRSQPTTYIVQSGDVLGLIAERFDADIAELRLINDLDGNLIRVGQELTIPALDGAAAAADDDTSDAADTTDTADASPAATSVPASGPVSCNSTATGHCIQPGESLQGIAFDYDVTVEALRAANPGVSGDLIKSGEVLNLPGGASNPTPTVAPTSPAGTTVPAATVGPLNDAGCIAANPLFPFFHAADGLCYANPIGATAIPTAVGASDVTCEPGRFLWQDGLCYPIPGVTVTPTVGATPTSGPLPDYGTIPCRDGYLPLDSGRCWPEPATTPSTVTPVGAATTTSGNTVTCDEPNFTSSANGTCFLLQAGVDAGCTLEAGVAKCPS